MVTPATAENAEYFSTIANFDYRIHPNWNVYVKGAYETASVYKANGIFEKGLYRTTWNAQACVEYFPMRNRELLIFAHMLTSDSGFECIGSSYRDRSRAVRVADIHSFTLHDRKKKSEQ